MTDISNNGINSETSRRLAGALIALLGAARHRVNTDDESGVVTMITEHIGCALAERVRLTEPMPHAALEELLDQRNRLTRSIVGGNRHPGSGHSVSPSAQPLR